MTQVSSIITRAYRESNLIDIKATPTANEMTEGLDQLQGLINSTLGNEVGYVMEDWTVTSATVINDPSGILLTAAQAAAFYVEPQTRLMASLTVATSVSLDPYPNDGQRFGVVDVAGNFNTYNLTIAGNGRKVNGAASLVISADGAAREFMYRSDLGDWVEVKTFVTTDDLPFPTDFNDFFTTSLAMRLNPAYGRDLPQIVMARYEQQRMQIIDRYKQSRLHGVGDRKKFPQSSGGE